MTKYYKVAGYVFSLSAADGLGVWDILTNYAPFELKEADAIAQKTVFRCTIADKLPSEPSELLLKENPEEDDMPAIDIYRHSEGYIFDMRPFKLSDRSFRLWTNSDFSKGVIQSWKGMPAGRFPVDNALMLLFALSTESLKTLEMHASVTVKDGKGYLFLGKSGTGKSTHSRMWLENIPGCHLLNDDNPIVRVLEDGSVRVYGSPWSGKTRCYVNEDYPVGGFAQIQQYPKNEIRRQSVLESYISIYASCSGLKMVEADNDLLHETIEGIIAGAPCWLMKCLPDGDAARVCCNTMTTKK